MGLSAGSSRRMSTLPGILVILCLSSLGDSKSVAIVGSCPSAPTRSTVCLDGDCTLVCADGSEVMFSCDGLVSFNRHKAGPDGSISVTCSPTPSCFPFCTSGPQKTFTFKPCFPFCNRGPPKPVTFKPCFPFCG